MGYNHASAYFLIALIFFATANPLTHAQPILGGLPGILPLPTLPKNVTVRGVLCCTPTGNCALGSPPAPGALVNVTCTGLFGNIVGIGQGITTANGSFSVTVNLTSLLSFPVACTVRIGLPLNSAVCPILSNVTGALVGIVGPIILLLGQLVATLLGFISISSN